jgi:predicted transcriptional regulator of viral defense system
LQTLENKAFYFIAGHGRGWVFSSSDLLEKFNRSQADNLLLELTKKGKIQRVIRGIYNYPKYSKLLNQYLSPDIDQVARAIARKFNWTIEISGESALNFLGLSTQVEAKYTYLSNGSNKSYDIFGTKLVFKKANLKNIGFKYKESSLIVQALKTLGKDNIDKNIIKKIKNYLDLNKCKKILKDTRNTTTWIYENIKQICQSIENE